MSKLLKRFANIFTKKPHSNTETTGEIRFIFDSNLSATQAKYKATSHEQQLQRPEQQERQEITAIQEQHQIMDESLYEKYIAVNEFKKKANEDIDINVNDQLLLLHKTYPDFYSVRNLRTQKNGFVPSNCIKPMNAMNSKTDSVKEWYFKDISRRDSERLLEYFENERGTFLIRDSSQEKGRYSLSILDFTMEKQRHAKHYLIERNENSEYFIKRSKCFKTIDDLIAFYTKNPDGICCRLLRPCPKETGFNDLKDIWEESPENIELNEMLGKGNFGEVYRGIWRKKFEVAVKTLNLDGSAAKDALDECETLKKLRHEKIIKLWCVVTSQNPIFIVIEYMCNGSLLEYMRKGDGRFLSFSDVVDCAAQIASGMKYMETLNFVHKDLAARNILVGKNKLVKIGDFGLAAKLNSFGKIYMNTENCLFPIKWTAPEIYKADKDGKRYYTIKSDVWAYGILLYELITLGQDPYKGLSNKEVMQMIEFENYRMAKPEGGLCTEPYYQKMLKCWHSDPQQRDTFESLCNFFNDYFINIEPGYRLNKT